MGEREEREHSGTRKTKKLKRGFFPFLVGFFALAAMAFGVYNLLEKSDRRDKSPVVKRVVQATPKQLEAVKREENRKEEVDKVKGRPFDRIGEETADRDIWEELKREAELAEREKSSAGSSGSLSLLSHDEIARELKVDLGEETGTDRRLYSANKKEVLETEKEEYKLERASMFAYSRTYRNAGYMEESGNQGMDTNHKGNETRGEGDAPADEEEGKRVQYNDHPMFPVGIGDILDAVVTHKIVGDTHDSPVVCSVSKDLLDNAGEWVIIPSGSRVIGRAGHVGGMGASRLFIYFFKLILPNGVSLDLNPNETVGLDAEGSLGVASEVERHFLLKFGTAFLVGLLDGLGGFAQSQVGKGGGASFFIDRSSENFQQVNGELLQQYSNIPPTVTVNPGHRMKIYFPRTLRLSGYEKARERAYGRG